MRNRNARPVAHRAFTLVEVLVTSAIIVLLLSLLLVGLNYASRAAREAATRNLMQSMSQALARFRTDHGYLPPILGIDRGYRAPPNLPANAGQQASFRVQIQGWYSVTSMAEYLVGYGAWNQDGYGYDAANGSGVPSEIPATGIRAPGADGVWGGATDRNGDGSYTLADRNPLDPQFGGKGQVYGPYLDLDDARLLGSISGTDPATGLPIVHLPGEPGYDDADPKAILDAWGNPIQYFRRLHPPGAPNQAWRGNVDNNGSGAIDPFDAPRLSAVFRLRPWQVSQEFVTDADVADFGNDTTSTRALEAAAFALFSTGPDGNYTSNRRRDTEEFNADNVVEVGE